MDIINHKIEPVNRCPICGKAQYDPRCHMFQQRDVQDYFDGFDHDPSDEELQRIEAEIYDIQYMI